MEVILPQNNSINFWSIGVNEEIDFISCHKIDYPIEDNGIVEGVSATMQKFCFIVRSEKDTSIFFKRSNVNKIEKSFNDIDDNYLFNLKYLVKSLF